ncbi:MAG: chemotaxis protein methyltransferase CheR [Colwellia sp.]|jgi:chemotaxis protein methyltransferase CheR
MVHVALKDNIKKILIEDVINSSDTVVLKKELILELKDIAYEINFIGIDSIPYWLVKRLVKMKSNVTIETTHTALWGYLSKLGIKNNLKNTYDFDESIRRQPIKAIVIGGSAGSIEKILELIKQLPYADIAIFIIVHISPHKKSILASIVQQVTQYQVHEAIHNTQVKNNCIYIAPPNYHLTIIDNYMYLDTTPLVSYSRPSITTTFKSLAYEYQSALVAILLCGYGNDGTQSLEDLKQNHSEVIILDPQECNATAMLLHAIETNNYTKILRLQEIAKYLKVLISVEVNIEDEIANFLETIKLTYGYDFINYDRKSLSRRIELTMKQSMISTFGEFKKAVFEDESLFAKLLSSFSINVTTFFRNPEVFKVLREEVVPYLDTFPSIRVWCAGCSRGDEPYSLAIMLDELGLLHKSLVYATDFNPRVLTEAKNGLFSQGDFANFESNYIKSAGKKAFRNWFEFEDNMIDIKEHIKKKVLFFQHNLVTDDSINEFHLIFCRNVLIYFNQNLQKTVFSTMDNSLFKGGVLVLGESEKLPEQYNYKVIGKKTYQKGLGN